MTKKEKKPSAYEEYLVNFHSFNTYNDALERIFRKGEKVENIQDLAVNAVPEDFVDREHAIKSIYELDPLIPEDFSALAKWVKVGGKKFYTKFNKNLTSNLEGIINDSKLSEDILNENLKYLYPNEKIEDKNYKKLTDSNLQFKQMMMIYGKAAKGKTNENEDDFMTNICVQDYIEMYDSKEDRDIIEALASLAKRSKYFRINSYGRILKEKDETFNKELKDYGIRKYVVDSVKDNIENNMQSGFFMGIGGINPEAKMKEQYASEEDLGYEDYPDYDMAA